MEHTFFTELLVFISTVYVNGKRCQLRIYSAKMYYFKEWVNDFGVYIHQSMIKSIFMSIICFD